MSILFISDLHLGISERNLERMRRPFSNPDQHDEAIIGNLNDALEDPKTHVYVAGDFADAACSFEHFLECVHKLENRDRLHIVYGNHDWFWTEKCKAKNLPLHGEGSLFRSTYLSADLYDVDGRRVQVTHIPYAMPFDGYNVHGHVHPNYFDPYNDYAYCEDFVKTLPRTLNANCELTGYRPASLDDLIEINGRSRKPCRAEWGLGSPGPAR